MEKKKEKTKKGSKPTSPEKTIGEMTSDLASKKRRTRQSDATVSLPLRMFLRGQEPCKKKVNSYFSLSYLEVVKKALEEDQIQILLDSQFGTLLGIGNKISFSVKFAHFLLCRQLVTKKTQEIWVLFGGQPIRFSIREFALAASLNCKVLTNEDDIIVSDQTKMFAKDLFGQEVPPTPKWIVEKLSGAPYKDRETRMRLALLLIVEGVLCRTSGEAKISLESVEVVRDIGRFLGYPWGRKSFDITMASIQTSLVHKYTQTSAAIQGFTHALQMVVLACSPNVLATDLDGSFSAGSDDEETNAVKGVVTKPMNLYMPLVRRLDHDDKGRQGDVISIMSARPDQRGVEKLVQVSDAPDPSVDYLLSLIRAKHKFTHQSWKGGVRAADIVNPRKVEEGESNQIDLQKLIANVGDACYERVKTLNEEMAVKMQDMLDLAVTSIETNVLLKFCQMERMIDGIFDIIRRSGPTANEPRPLSESTTSGTIPPEDATKPGSDGVNQTVNVNVESPNRVVRNVLADLNAVADEVSGGGDETYGEKEVDTNPAQNTKMDVEDRNLSVDLNDVADEVSGGGNESCNEDQISSKSSENKKMDAGLLSEENNERSASKAMVDEQEENDAHDSEPQPLDSFPRGHDFSTMGIVPYEDPEDQVILLGYKNEDVVSVTDEEIRQTMDVVIGGKDDDVGETSGTVNIDGNVDQPPSFSLGLTQELQ